MHRIQIPFVAVLAACSPTLGGPHSHDAGPLGSDAGEPIIGAVRDEICGNEIDDDDNGEIDDGCVCDAGASRPCWLGPPDARGVGACRDGVQLCLEGFEFWAWGGCEGGVAPTREIIDNGVDDDCDGDDDEPDGICVPVGTESGDVCGNGRDDDCDTLRDCDDPECAGAAGCPEACQPTESLCFGGRDDDCDGAVDCDDAECFSDPACSDSVCPDGLTPVYSERDLGTDWGASSISSGDGNAVMPLSCEDRVCAAGLVAVRSVSGTIVCVPPPSECPDGLSPTYVSAGTWRCDPPCDLIIHYGSIYGGERRCAGIPTVSCPSGQVPTFVYEMETWECRPTCDNGLYDRIYVEGGLVCVPC